MTPFQMLCVRIYRYPISWFEVGEATFIGPSSVHKAMEKVQLIKRGQNSSDSS